MIGGLDYQTVLWNFELRLYLYGVVHNFVEFKYLEFDFRLPVRFLAATPYQEHVSSLHLQFSDRWSC